MDLNIDMNERKNKVLKIILFIFLITNLCVLGYYFFRVYLLQNPNIPIPKESNLIEGNLEKKISFEEELPSPQNTTETEKNYFERFLIIDGEQTYILLPPKIDVHNPPTLIIYSHGSTSTVTANLQDKFMSDLQKFGLQFIHENYIFSASNQHGINKGNDESVQDTLNLKNWIAINFPIKDKIYLIGYSMGSSPSLNFTTKYPETVSKIALLAPVYYFSEWDEKRAQNIMDIDIKIWHSPNDKYVSYSRTERFVSLMKDYGIDIILRTVNETSHFDLETGYAEEILEFFNR
jgi:alpha/beta superfamily hydrolase